MIGLGDARLNAGTTLTVNAQVDGGTGSISLLAVTAVVQNVDGDVLTAGAGSIDADSAAITMADGALTGVDGNVRYDAAAGDLMLGGEVRTGADVSLIAGNVVDAEDGADANVDITADELKVDLAGAFGESDDHIRTTVRQMSGDAEAGRLVPDRDGRPGDRRDVRDHGGGTCAVDGRGRGDRDTTDAVQTDLGVGDALVVVVEAGNPETLTTGAITAGSNVLLRTDAAMGDLTLGANLVSTAGAISLDAHEPDAERGRRRPGAGRSIDVVKDGATMADGMQTTTSNGNVRARSEREPGYGGSGDGGERSDAVVDQCRNG